MDDYQKALDLLSSNLSELEIIARLGQLNLSAVIQATATILKQGNPQHEPKQLKPCNRCDRLFVDNSYALFCDRCLKLSAFEESPRSNGQFRGKLNKLLILMHQLASYYHRLSYHSAPCIVVPAIDPRGNLLPIVRSPQSQEAADEYNAVFLGALSEMWTLYNEAQAAEELATALDEMSRRHALLIAEINAHYPDRI